MGAYGQANVEFLCVSCLSQNWAPAERFMARFVELHKRRDAKVIPSGLKIGRSELRWFDVYASVVRVGGLGAMKELSAWDRVRAECGLNVNFKSQTVWRTLRDEYVEWLYGYERQYYPLTARELPRALAAIVQQKGALDGLF